MALLVASMKQMKLQAYLCSRTHAEAIQFNLSTTGHEIMSRVESFKARPLDMNQAMSRQRGGLHYERLLVVSDNPELCNCLLETLQHITLEHPFSVDFKYTSYNTEPSGMITLGADKINIKDEAMVDFIIGNYDLVFSLHCKQIFPKRLVEQVCCINFHPGLNPFNRGWFPQAFSILNGLPIGATVHMMDERVDHGDIIDQQEVEACPADTSYDLYQRVIAAEKALIQKNLYPIIENVFAKREPSFEGNYNGLADFRRLCALDLNHIGTLGEHLNLLKATTHGAFKNAYFYGPDGMKYFVSICVDVESKSAQQ